MRAVPFRIFLAPVTCAVVAAGGLAAAAAAGGVAPALAAAAPSCSAGTCTLSYATAGAGQSLTVPAGVSSLSVTLYGGTGGANFSGDGPGGDGAEVTAALAVTPGAALGVDVGGAGVGGPPGAHAGGVNGGGSAVDDSGAGGGATDVTSSGTDLLVAGGGGGGGGDGTTTGDCPSGPATLPGGTGGNADTAGAAGQGYAARGFTVTGGGGGGAGTTMGAGSGGSGGETAGTDLCPDGSLATGGNGASGSGGNGGNGVAGTGGGGGGGYSGGGAGGGGATESNDDGHVEAGTGGGGGGASYDGGAGVSGASVDDTGNSGQVNGGDGEAVFTYADPVATGAPSYTTTENQALTVPASDGLLSSTAGTSGPAGDTLAASGPAGGTTAQGGTVTVNSDGSFSYTPPSASFTGTDSFTYTVTDTSADGGGDYADGTAAIQVQPAGWTPAAAGAPSPATHAAEGYYLGVTASTWTLKVTHPGTAKVVFTGTITINTGRFTKLTPIELEHNDSHSVKGKTLTFHFSNAGDIDGLRFTTAAATSVTFTLAISGHPATASQIYLGSATAPSGTGSPLTFTR